MAPFNCSSPIRTVAPGIVACPSWLTQQFIENIYKADDIRPNVKYKQLISYHIEPANVRGENYTTLLYRIQMVVELERIRNHNNNNNNNNKKKSIKGATTTTTEELLATIPSSSSAVTTAQTSTTTTTTTLSDDELSSTDSDEISTDSGVISAPAVAAAISMDSLNDVSTDDVSTDSDEFSTDIISGTGTAGGTGNDQSTIMNVDKNIVHEKSTIKTNQEINSVKNGEIAAAAATVVATEKSPNKQSGQGQGQRRRRQGQGQGQQNKLIRIKKAYIIKAMPNIDLSQNYADSCNVFDKETEMYFSVIPQLEKIYKQSMIKNDDDDHHDDGDDFDDCNPEKIFAPKYIPQFVGNADKINDIPQLSNGSAQKNHDHDQIINGTVADADEQSSRRRRSLPNQVKPNQENPLLENPMAVDDGVDDETTTTTTTTTTQLDDNADDDDDDDGPISNVIILEDLKASGFRLANRLVGLDLEHSRAVLKKLAKFHAASAKLYELNGDYSEQLREGMYNERMATIFESFYDHTFSVFHECMSKNWPSGPVYSHQVASWRKNLFAKVQKNFAVNPNGFNVLNHGDLWTNNFMFKYYENAEGGDGGNGGNESPSPSIDIKSNKKPKKTIKDIIFIDLQLSVWGSPAIDLNYFIISSCAPTLKIAEFDNFIRYYHKHLLKALHTFGYKRAMPTLAALQKDVLDRGFLAVMASTGILPMVLMKFEATDDIDVSCFMKSDEGSNKMKCKLYNNPVYIEIMEKLLPVFNSKGLLDPI